MFPEVLQILSRLQCSVQTVTGRTAHGEDLAWQYPIHVTLVNMAEVVVATHIEGLQVVKFQRIRFINSSKAVLKSQLKLNLPDATITVCKQFLLNFVKLFLHNLRRLFQA